MPCSIVGVVVTGCLAMSPRPTGQEAAATFARVPHVEYVQPEFKVPQGWTYIGSIHGEVLGSWSFRWITGPQLSPWLRYDRAYVGDGLFIGTGFGTHRRTDALGRRRGEY